MRVRGAIVVFFVAASIGAAEGPPLGPRDPKRLKPGVFLYAAPGLVGGSFTESVVLLVQHEDGGSMGLIINRPTKVPVQEAVPQLGERPGVELPLYFGGPVEVDGVLALVRSAKAVDGATRVLPDVYLCNDLRPVKQALRRPEVAQRLRVYAGYAGWTAGQLADELRAGAWVVGPADARSVFTSEPSSLWPRVHDLMRRIEVRDSRYTSERHPMSPPGTALQGREHMPARRERAAFRPLRIGELDGASLHWSFVKPELKTRVSEES